MDCESVEYRGLIIWVPLRCFGCFWSWIFGRTVGPFGVKLWCSVLNIEDFVNY